MLLAYLLGSKLFLLLLTKIPALCCCIFIVFSLWSVTIPDAQSQTFVVSAADNLQQALDASHDGDTVLLKPGRYFGNFSIKQQITLRGASQDDNKAIIDAQGLGHALTLSNAQITIDNLTIVNWGHDLSEQNSGIYVKATKVKQKKTNITIKNNKLRGDGFGIWLNDVIKTTVFNNIIEGNLALRSADRGNGIQVSNATHSHIYSNETFHVRDGIYVISSQNNLIENNKMHHLRYGIHYMYSYDDTVQNNIAYNTRAGYALMSSGRLTVTGNKTHDSEDYGFLLNFITQSTLRNNDIKNVWAKADNKVIGRYGRGLFIYNSSANVIAYNLVDSTEIGIHLTAGSENIEVYGNSFINNPTQVKYVSNKKQEWSKHGRGNYWSNYLGWDLNNDGIGDVIYEPNEGIDKLVWQYPEMKMIMDSPAILILRWVQKQFSVLKPPGVKDSFPLMSKPNASEGAKI